MSIASGVMLYVTLSAWPACSAPPDWELVRMYLLYL